jgi:hypothetical protein
MVGFNLIFCVCRVFVRNVKICYLFCLPQASYLTCSVIYCGDASCISGQNLFVVSSSSQKSEGFKFSYNPSVLWHGYWTGFCSERRRRTKAKNAFVDFTPCSLVAWYHCFRGGSKCVSSKLGHGFASHKAVDLSIATVRASDIAKVEIQVCAT